MRYIRLVVVLLIIAFFMAIFFSYQGWRRLAANTPDQGMLHEIAAESELQFLIIGDQGSGSSEQKKVAEAMESLCNKGSINGVLLLGDNFYPKGVSSSKDSQWQEKFENVYLKGCLGMLRFYSTLGNHDYKGKAEAQIEYGYESPNWFLPGRFYGLRLGELLEIINIDTTMLDFCFNEKNCSLDFLMSRLSAPKTTQWRIVMGHHPMRSSSTKGFTYDGHDFRAMILRKQICGRADLALFGHSHHLELRKDDDCATPFAIIGGGGAGLVKVQPQGEPLFLKSTYGFGLLGLSKQEMRLSFYNENGEELFKKTF